MHTLLGLSALGSSHFLLTCMMYTRAQPPARLGRELSNVCTLLALILNIGLVRISVRFFTTRKQGKMWAAQLQPEESFCFLGLGWLPDFPASNLSLRSCILTAVPAALVVSGVLFSCTFVHETFIFPCRTTPRSLVFRSLLRMLPL